MSIQITIIADNIPELVASLHEHLKIFSALGVASVDKDYKADNLSSVEAAPANATPPSTPEAFTPAITVPAAASTLKVSEIVDVLTKSYKDGDADVRAKIVSKRDELGIKYLSQAKDEHASALAGLARELGAL